MTAPSAAMRAADAIMALFKDRDRLAYVIRNGNEMQVAVARNLLAKTIDAALAASPAGEAWRPIETAPKDGTLVIIGNPEWRVMWVAQYNADRPAGMTRDTWGHYGPHWTRVGFQDTGLKPTHWQPLLPSPPAEAGR